MAFHVLSTLALIFGLKSGLTPPCLWSPLLHSRSNVPFSEGILRCCGIKDITGEALMASIELQITITQERSDPQHCRSSETRRLQLWDRGSHEKWNRSSGKNRERNYTGSLGQKSRFLHMPFFYGQVIYGIWASVFWSSNWSSYIPLLSPYSLWACILQRSRGYILFLIYQLYLTNSTLPGSPVHTYLLKIEWMLNKKAWM